MNSFNAFINKTIEKLSDFIDPQEVENFVKSLYLPEGKSAEGVSGHKEHPKDISEEIELNDKNRVLLDGFITLAEKCLPIEKHLIFLQNIGQYSISIGELSLASDIYKSVLRKVNKRKQFGSISAYANFYLGDIASRQALWQESLSYIKKARKSFALQNDLMGLAMCENLTGIICGEKGELEKAFANMENSLTFLSQINDKSLSAMVENNLGIMNTISGNLEYAYMYYCRALAKFEELNDIRRIIEVRHNLGMLFVQKEQFTQALNEFGISISLALKENQLTMLGLSYIGKAYIYTKINDVDLAAVYTDKGMEISYKLNDKLSIADIYKLKGIIFRIKKSFEISENYFHSSLRLNEELDNKLNYAETCFELGVLYNDMNKTADKSRYLKKAYNYFKKIGHPAEMVKIEAFLNSADLASI